METATNAKPQYQKKEYDRIEAEVTPDIEKFLLRYLEIQKISKELEDERGVLQAKISGHLSKHSDGFWFPVVKDIPLKIRFFRETEVEYDENVLRARLGPKYRQILSPDLKKIRANLSELGETLAPVIEKIGSPDRGKVRGAIEAGAMRPEDFAGAFKKQTKPRLAVMRLHQGESV